LSASPQAASLTGGGREQESEAGSQFAIQTGGKDIKNRGQILYRLTITVLNSSKSLRSSFMYS